MNLFGCKFCKYIEVKHTGRLEFECSRKNFDSLLWATLTVFQVIKNHLFHNRKHIYSYMSSMGLPFYVVIDVSMGKKNPSQRHKKQRQSYYPRLCFQCSFFSIAQKNTHVFCCFAFFLIIHI